MNIAAEAQGLVRAIMAQEYNRKREFSAIAAIIHGTGRWARAFVYAETDRVAAAGALRRPS